MNPSPMMTTRLSPVTSLQVGRGLACITLFLSLCAESMGLTQREQENPQGRPSMLPHSGV